MVTYVHCWRCGSYQLVDEMGTVSTKNYFEVSVSGTCWLCSSTIDSIFEVSNLKVIGSIQQNPELLEEAKTK